MVASIVAIVTPLLCNLRTTSGAMREVLVPGGIFCRAGGASGERAVENPSTARRPVVAPLV
jgi:hypothetical protein